MEVELQPRELTVGDEIPVRIDEKERKSSSGSSTADALADQHRGKRDVLSASSLNFIALWVNIPDVVQRARGGSLGGPPVCTRLHFTTVDAAMRADMNKRARFLCVNHSQRGLPLIR